MASGCSRPACFRSQAFRCWKKPSIATAQRRNRAGALACSPSQAKGMQLPCFSSRHEPCIKTLWPSGYGVGLLSRWGLPAWVRIPQVSLAQPPAALQPCVCGHAGELPALRTTACLQLRPANNELVTGSWQSWGGAISHSAALQRHWYWFLIAHHLTHWPSG